MALTQTVREEEIGINTDSEGGRKRLALTQTVSEGGRGEFIGWKCH